MTKHTIWEDRAMTDSGRHDDTPNADDAPPVPPLANDGDDDITLPNPGSQSDPTLSGAAGGDPTLIQPATAPATAVGVGAGAGLPPTGGGGTMPPTGDDPDRSGRPAWLIPAAGGLVAGLVVALGFVALTGGDDADAPVAVDSTIEPTTTVAAEVAPVDSEPAESTVAPESTAPEGTALPEAETTVAPAPETTAAPAPETTTAPAPDSTVAAAPETTLSPNGIPVAPKGTVLVNGTEHPIARTCSSNPVPGAFVISYLYFDGSFPEIVEFGSDEGNDYGTAFGDSYDIDDFGDDGFGMIVFQGDSGFPVSVNPATGEFDECGSVTITDPTNLDFPSTIALVDVCLGDVTRLQQADDDSVESITAFGYQGVTAESGEFSALPSANGDTFDVQFTSPNFSFSGDDPAATGGGVTGVQIEANPVGNPGGSYAGQSRNVVINIPDTQVRDCPTF